ncbi:MAG: ABC transporter substrate-binding protein [Acidimicrobiia bacterium]|nr:ABC transporter substrate-binding protein [Acidimicrobiia bacterium]
MRSTERRTTRTTRTLVGVLAGLSLVAAACGNDDSSEDTVGTDAPASTEASAAPNAPAATDAPGATDAAADEADMADVPERVVSLSPTHTEIMFAIGAGDQLVAVDEFSNYPPEALELPNDLSGFEPNIEAIAGFEPDVVLIGGDFSGVGEQLAAIDIASWDGPAAATVDDTYAQITQLGELTGHVDEADALVASMQEDLEALIASTPVPAEALSIYHELDPTYFSADSTTFIGEIYALFGLRNIADEAEGSGGAFPQLNAEFIVSTNPDMIFLADTKCCGETVVTVSARDGWGDITAVQNGAVIEMDDDIASRWGPRVVDYAAAVAAAVTTAAG